MSACLRLPGLLQSAARTLRMAAVSQEALAKLESKAVAAESLIQMLKQQVAEVQAVQGGLRRAEYAREAEQLRAENLALKTEVEVWKQKLSKAEVANGKVVLCGNPTGSKVEEVVPKAEAPVTEEEAPKKEKKAKAEKAPKEKKPAPEDEAPVDIGRLDLRVGHIRSAKKHPDADSLYVEEVDVGEDKPRTVISGLVRFIPEAEMQDRLAVILCNLKPSKMRGILSEAMVMCASTPDKVEILAPPAGAQPGDPVEVVGYTRAPDTQLNPKKKIFEAVAPDLMVNSSQQATYKGVLWTVNGAPVTSQSLVGVNIK